MRLSLLLFTCLFWQQPHRNGAFVHLSQSPLGVLSTTRPPIANQGNGPFDSSGPGFHKRWFRPSASALAKSRDRTMTTMTTVSPTALAAASPATTAVSLGFWGNAGVMTVSIVLVKAVYALAARKDVVDNDNDVHQQAGILNRCPWPFIFFHDVRQGLKDSPTWMVVTFAVMRLLVKRLVRLPLSLILP